MMHVHRLYQQQANTKPSNVIALAFDLLTNASTIDTLRYLKVGSLAASATINWLRSLLIDRSSLTNDPVLGSSGSC
ncbi:MAG: hypothetical protein AAGA03_09065 [Planctomycetota bacterium]